MKHRIKLTESDLRKIVKNAVNEVLSEIGDSKRGRDYIHNALSNSATKDVKRKLKSRGPLRDVPSDLSRREKINKYMENGPHGKEWKEEGQWHSVYNKED